MQATGWLQYHEVQGECSFGELHYHYQQAKSWLSHNVNLTREDSCACWCRVCENITYLMCFLTLALGKKSDENKRWWFLSLTTMHGHLHTRKVFIHTHYFYRIQDLLGNGWKGAANDCKSRQRLLFLLTEGLRMSHNWLRQENQHVTIPY